MQHPKPKHWRSKRYREWISRKPSILSGAVPCVPHHHRHGADGGTGLKPSDSWCVPVTWDEHIRIHTFNLNLENDLVQALCLKQLTEYLVEHNIK